jgi:hypothetical protein
LGIQWYTLIVHPHMFVAESLLPKETLWRPADEVAKCTTLCKTRSPGWRQRCCPCAKA